MLVKDFECRSYKQAEKLLGEKSHIRVCNNTDICTNAFPNDDAAIVVRLHWHEIVAFYSDGRIILDSCGYKTIAVKDRINKCLPTGMYLIQRGFKWWIDVRWVKTPRPHKIEFIDGMNVGTGIYSIKG